MLRVLIAEDSHVIQRTLKALLEGEDGIEIVGLADDGAQAVRMCKELGPDLVTMDIFMPEMDGLEATRKIMEECPTRIVIISAAVGGTDVANSFEALRAGAIEVIEKPRGILAGNYSEVKINLSNLLRRIATARPTAQISWLPPRAAPVRSGFPGPVPASADKPEKPGPRIRPMPADVDLSPKIVCVGGSIGASTVLVEVLSYLPASYPYPIVVAQHITRGFAKGMASWLDSSVDLDVELAVRGSVPRPGLVLIAPDDNHLEITAARRVRLRPPDPSQDYIPSIDIFFESVAMAYGEDALAVILSGMGQDGASGMASLYDKGATTLAQNEMTSVVYGMAKVAVDAGVVMKSVTPLELAYLLLKIGQ